MGYLLLTGATGLVGRYLLRSLIRADVPVAALVRSDKVDTAAERVEAVLAHWESQLGFALPRPVILPGGLHQPDLGLEPAQRRWVADHCASVLHCAASMTFREDKRGEPFRTNVEGTRNLLTFCRDAGIRGLHHVSTAYICGLRTGRVLEDEVDLGQPLGNVYEQSKLQAELMVRSADFLDQATIYRPASVIGDSRTGYVTSYHGFYLPLQLAYTVATRIPPRAMDDRFFARLGLRGDEGKNLVPVDWLAAAIVELVTHPEHHGRTYHLASPEPVTVRMIQAVIREALQRYDKRPLAVAISDEELAAFEGIFHDHMMIYRSHWRDDPVFDLTNTQRALADLPCPAVDHELLLRVARYPVEQSFSTRRQAPPVPRFDVSRHLAPWLEAAGPAVESRHLSVGLQVNGCGGGQWQLLIDGDRVQGAGVGLGPDAGPRLYLTSHTFGSLVRGESSLEQAVRGGRVLVEGAAGASRDLLPVLAQVISAR